ncbi:MAG: succinate dehydrogenase iron-sulfur subunit [Thermodesulfobacteriota bacterium]
MTHRDFKIFRYDPAVGGEGHFDSFHLEIQDEAVTTVLDALLRIQREHDPSLSFRYACRIAMCGSCGMVINGREGLACKTVLADLKPGEITLRPLNHLPIIKDLAVDMGPFFDQYVEGMPYFEPSGGDTEPAVIRPDSWERGAIGLSTECIACGCCVSSCTMAHWHKEYLGPAALNRALTLLADSRDALRTERLAQVLKGCYNCRSELNCTEVCPKEISPTRAIKHIQRMAVLEGLRPCPSPPREKASQAAVKTSPGDQRELSRRRFLTATTAGIGAAAVLFLAGLITTGALAPAMRDRPRHWVRVGPVKDFPQGGIRTVQIRYTVEDGFYRSLVEKPVLVSRIGGSGDIAAYSSRCPHLGCTVRWDQAQQLFLCACHGGTFYPDGRVKAGPPTRPLDPYRVKVEAGDLFVLEA